jgi:hypothetical protein
MGVVQRQTNNFLFVQNDIFEEVYHILSEAKLVNIDVFQHPRKNKEI